jgi:hypothetical protein
MLNNNLSLFSFCRILHKSPKLKVLDIRGRCNECYSALLDLPATDVESLHIGTISTCLDDPYMDLLMMVRKLHGYLLIYYKIAGLCNKSMKFINKCIVVIIKYLHMAKQCKADIWQINIMWTSLGGTRHSHTQKSTFIPEMLKYIMLQYPILPGDNCGCDRMVVGFNTTCTISAYHHWSCEFEPHSWQGVLDTTLCDKVCQWLMIGQWFSTGTPLSSNNKTDRHHIT